MARKIKKRKLIGPGCFVQIIGIVLFYWGLESGGPTIAVALCLLGAIILIVGFSFSYKWMCKECGGRVKYETTETCPHCKINFES